MSTSLDQSRHHLPGRERLLIRARAVPRDLNGDCQVDIVDVQLVASLWRCESGDARHDRYRDLDGSGRIDLVDIMRVVADWRASCS